MDIRKRIRSTALGALWLASITLTSESLAQAPTPGSVIDSAAGGIEAIVDDAVRKAMSERHVAGAQVAIVRNGSVALLKGYGIDRVSPERNVDPSRSLFRIGSISKTFAWIALMQLEERGKLQLSDPVNDRLPDALKIPDEGFVQPIRVIDLMNHTAGFEDILQGLFTEPTTTPLALGQQLQKYRPHRVREPGQLFAYSNYGAALAGALIAHVSGVEYEKYVEDNILRPLSLNNTTLREEYDAGLAGLPAPMPAELVANKALALEWRNNAWIPFPQEHLISMAPAGSGVSTASDIATYMTALLSPEHLESAGVLKKATFAKMKEPSFQAAPGMPGMHHGFFNGALGQKSILEVDNFSHTGSTLHFFSITVLIPDLSRPPTYAEPGSNSRPVSSRASGSLGIFITTNSQPGRLLVDALPELIVAKLIASGGDQTAHTRPSPPADFQARASEYVGSYSQLRRSYTTAEKIRALSQVIGVSATPDGFLQIGSGAQSMRAVEIAKDLFKQINGDATTAFKRDEQGHITHMVMMVGAFQLTGEKIGFFKTPLWFGFILLLVAVTSLAVVVAALWRLIKKRNAHPGAERYAAISMTCAGLAWLGFIAALVLLLVQLLDVVGQDKVLMNFPPLVLRTAMALVLVGFVATIATLGALIPAWSSANWSRTRTIRHVAAIAIFLVLAITLAEWNLIGFRYY